MAGQDDIVQRIVLAGQQDVVAGFNSIQRAAKNAFEAVQNSANASSFAGFAEVLGGVTLAISGVVVGLEQLAKSGSDTVIQMSNLATESGTFTENFTSLIGVLRGFGDTTDSITNVVRRLAVRVETDWPLIQKQIRGSALQATQDILRLKQAQLDAAQASITAANQQKQADITRRQDLNSVEGAALSLIEAQARLNALRSGEAIDADLQAELNDRRAILQVNQAQAALDEARLKKAQDIAEAPLKAAQAQLKLQEEQLKVQEAAQKQIEDQANSITNLKTFVDNLADGVTNAGSKVQLSTQNIIKGLIASVGPGVTALEDFKGSLGTIGLTAPALYPVLLKLADIFKNTQDETLKMAIAVAAFGRGVSPTMVNALSQGSKAIQDEQARLESLGLTFTSIKQRGEKSDEFISRQFRNSLSQLGRDVQIVSTQFGLLFAPGFTDIFKDIATSIEKNRGAILDFGDDIRDKVIPVFGALARALLGIPDAANPIDQTIKGWIDGFKSFGRAVDTAVNGVIIPALKILQAAFNLIADGINAVFGTKITGADIAVVAAIAKITGAFGLLGLALGALASGPLALVLAGLTIVVAIAAAVGTTDILGKLADAPKLAEFSKRLEAIKAEFAETGDINKRDEAMKALGVEFRKWSEEGSESFKKVKDAGEQSASGVEAAFKEKLDGVNKAFEKLGTGGAGGAASGTLTQQLLTPLQRINQDAEKLAGKFDAVSTAATQLGSTATTKLRQIGDLTKIAGDQTDRLSASIKLVPQQFLDAQKVQAFSDAFVKANGGLDQIRENIKKFGTAFAPAEGMAGRFAEAFNKVATEAVPAVKGLEEGLKNLGLTRLNAPNQDLIDLLNNLQKIPPAASDAKDRLENFWKSTSEEATGDGQRLNDAFTSLLSKLQEQTGTKALADGLENVAQKMRDAGAGADQFGQKLGATDTTVGHGKTALQGLIDSITSTISNLSSSTGQQLVAAFTTSAQQAGTALTTGFQTAWDQVRGVTETGIQGVISVLQSGLSGASGTITSILVSAFQSAVDQIGGILDTITQKVATLLQNLQSAQQAASQINVGGGGSDSGIGLASGGLFRGRPGRDTNLAWLTDFEFVMNPQATRFYGPGLMHAINNMMLPLNSLRGFSLGGLVSGMRDGFSMPIPRFAGGGPVLATSPSVSRRVQLDLTSNGRPLGSLFGDDKVVESVVRHATFHQQTSSGRSPSWRGR